MNYLTSALIIALLAASAVCAQWQVQSDAVEVPEDFQGCWSLVVLPDIQYYSDLYPGITDMQCQWIVDNVDRINAQYVLLPGDITNGNSPREWQNASAALARLEGNVPYAMCSGNHDCGPKGWAQNRTSGMDEYFPYERFARCTGIAGARQNGEISNSFHLFTAGDGSEWMIVCLEWSPRDEVLLWAGDILDKHSDRKAIVMTHAYLYYDCTRYDWSEKGKGQQWNPLSYPTAGGNDGQRIWEKLIREHANVFMVINGHVLGDGTGVLISENNAGTEVIQMLANYQSPMNDIGGGGWLRVLTFSNDMTRIACWSYSPLYRKYRREPDQLFEFKQIADQPH